MTRPLEILATEFFGVSDEADVYEATLNAVGELSETDRCWIFRDEAEGPVPVETWPESNLEGLSSLSPVSLPALCIESGEAQLIPDRANTRSTTSSNENEVFAQHRTLGVVPLDADTLLVCGSREPHAISTDAFAQVKDIATYAEIALDEARSRDTEPAAELKEVASVLSHDVRNIVTVLESRFQLAQADGDLDHLDDIDRTLDRLVRLIDDVVTLLRTGERELDVASIDLEAAATEAWRTIDTQDASLSVDRTGRVAADESCLTELLANLFKNAIDHGGSDVTVHVGLLDDETGFYVEDTGDGIPPAQREEIFAYGYSSEEGHTGLGLNIVRWLADAHDWSISVTEGEMAGGARFEIRGVQEA